MTRVVGPSAPTDSPAAPRSAEPGSRVTPQVRLVRPLGAGGMGTVWLARHEALGVDVAVKLVNSMVAASPTALRRFEREAALLAKVRSPHVVAVLDAGESPELGPYLVMELLEGHDLGVELDARGRLEPREVLTIAEQVGSGLKRAHDAGLVHRDLKPGNLFLCAGMGTTPFVKILDFGVAFAEGEETQLTQAGDVVGTRSTMSPEQAAGRPVDARSDLYSLALVLFRLMTGTAAIPRASLEALGLAAYRMERPRPSALVPSLPAEVDSWFARATEPEPEARFADVDTWLVALQGAMRACSPPVNAPAESTVDDGATLPEGESPGAEPALGAATPATPEPDGDERGRASATPPRASARRWRLGAVAALTLLLASITIAITSAHRAPRAVDPSRAPTASSDAAAGPGEPASDAGRPEGRVRLALLTDLSGANRRRGSELERAARTAVAAINREGGVRGRTLVLDTLDDQGASGAFLSARALEASTRASVPAVLGPLLSPQAVEVGPALAERGVLAVSATATAESLAPSDRAPGLFVGLAPSDDAQGPALARAAKGRSGAPLGRPCRRLAIVAASDAHGAPFAQALEAEARAAPSLETTRHLVPPEPRRRYDDLVAEVAREKADCLALLVSPKVGGRVVTSIPAAQRKGLRLLAGDSLASRDFIEFARGDVEDVNAPSLAEGVEGVAVASAAPDRAELSAFRRQFRATHGGDPDEPFAAHQFDAVVLLALAIEAEGLAAPSAKLRDAMIRISQGKSGYGPSELGRLLRAVARGEDAGYEGASGDLDLGPNGRVQGAFEPWVVKGGKIVRGSPSAH